MSNENSGEALYPNKAGLPALISEVNAWRIRLGKNDVKLPTEEYKAIGVWLFNVLQHVAELTHDQDEMAAALADDAPEGIAPETAATLINTLSVLIEHAGGLELLPPEIKLQVAETFGVIKDLQGDEGAGES